MRWNFTSNNSTVISSIQILSLVGLPYLYYFRLWIIEKNVLHRITDAVSSRDQESELIRTIRLVSYAKVKRG
jgi:hypothetical protein